MITDQIKEQLGKFKASSVKSQYGDWRVIQVDYTGGYCIYECDVRREKTKNHEYFDLDWTRIV